MSRFCKTSVDVTDDKGNHLNFRVCGKPAIITVIVGQKECHYCLEHGMEAREFVKTMGEGAIIETQEKSQHNG